MIRLLHILLFFTCSFLLASCSQHSPVTQPATEKASQALQTQTTRKQQITTVPLKVIEVLKYIRIHHTAPPGYVGSRHFGNFEGRLPELDSAGKRINYQEWDVNAHQKGLNRGAERLITGSDSSAYYTPNHYESFIPVKDAN